MFKGFYDTEEELVKKKQSLDRRKQSVTNDKILAANENRDGET